MEEKNQICYLKRKKIQRKIEEERETINRERERERPVSVIHWLASCQSILINQKKEISLVSVRWCCGLVSKFW